MPLITLLGPNLRDQSKGSFHIHAAGCGDIRRRYSPWDNAWTEDYDSLEEVVTAVYSDIIDESGEPWTSYLGDFHVCPCVRFNGD